MPGTEQQRSEIVVGLVATPPDYPARVAARLTAELAGRLAERVDADVRWTVREGWGEVAPRRDGGVEALLDDLARRRADDRWDVAICLTDLPLHTERVPLVAQTSARRRVAMVSLPALGLRQLRAVRAAVPDLVGRLLTDASDERVPPAGWAPAELASRVAAIHRVVGEADAGELGYVASRLIGRVRLLTGMVRANRPGRALLGLSKLLVGAFGTAAFALTTNTIWQMGDALGGLRLTVIMLLGLTALVAWLIVAHDLWEKPDRETSAELARLFNLGTILTLTLATAVSYAGAVRRNGARRGAADRHIRAGTDPAAAGRFHRLPDARLDHQLAGHRRRRDRLRAGGRGNGAGRRLRLPSRTRRLAGRQPRIVPPPD